MRRAGGSCDASRGGEATAVVILGAGLSQPLGRAVLLQPCSTQLTVSLLSLQIPPLRSRLHQRKG